MADYIQAFKQGLEAADAVKIASQEIDSVFAELDSQMTEASGGKIKITLQQRYVADQGHNSLSAGMSAMFFMSGKKRETYWAISAVNPLAQGPSIEIATWNQARTGYPCKISFHNVERLCNDRESLERSLAEILSDPTIAQKLSNLTLREIPAIIKTIEKEELQSDTVQE